MPEPHLFYPLTLTFSGQDLSGRENNMSLNSAKIVDSTGRLGGALEVKGSYGDSTATMDLPSDIQVFGQYCSHIDSLFL